METQCRLCGSNDAILYNLFHQDQLYLHYVKKIHKLLPISINKFDPLPKSICHRCAFKITEFYEFRMNCLRTQENFKAKLPWFNPNQEHRPNSNNGTPMVEVNLSSIDHFSPTEKYFDNSFSNQDDGLIVIEDDDDNEDTDGEADNNSELTLKPTYDQRKSFSIESSDRLDEKLKKPASVKKMPVWHARNSNHFGKRKRRRKKSCKIDHIFSTSSSLYQNMGQLDIIDPTEYINAQEYNDRIVSIKKTNEDQLNVLPNTKKSVESEDESEGETKLPSGILVTKIPNVGYAYTCKICRRTFLASSSAVTHDCDSTSQHTKKSSLHYDVGKGGTEPPERTKNFPDHNRRTDPVPMTTNNNNSENLYVCDICNKIFPRQVILLAHKKQHFVSYSSSDSELETFKIKRQHRRNYKIRLDKGKKRLNSETCTEHKVQNQEFGYVS